MISPIQKNINSLKTFKPIIANLIYCCNDYNKKNIILLLKSGEVKTGMTNKLCFYNFFCFMLECRQDTEKLYKFKILTWKNQRCISLQFFEKNRKFPCLIFVLNNQNGKLFLELLPF